MRKVYTLLRGGINCFQPAENLPEAINAYLPSLAVVPFMHHEGISAEPVIVAGDYVREGQLIASPVAENSLPVHAPVPGIIVRLCTVSVGNDTCVDAALIKMNGSFSILGKSSIRSDWQKKSADSLCKMLRDNGIVNNAVDPSALYADVERVKNLAPVLIVRLFDRDPSFIMDSFFALHHISDVVDGVAITALASKASSVIFAVGKSLYSQIATTLAETIRSVFTPLLFPAMPQEICVVEEKYPVGGKKELVETLQSARLFPYDKPVLYIDAETAFTTADSIIYNRPVLERYVYVSGSAIAKSAFMKVRIGTRIGSIIDECGGFTAEPARIVVNGLFSGSSVYDLDTPVTKSTLSITILSKDDFSEYQIADCISCGACIPVCPAALNPMRMYALIRNKRELDALRCGGTDCSFCGCCATVCPSRLPLSHLFRRLSEKSLSRKEAYTDEKND